MINVPNQQMNLILETPASMESGATVCQQGTCSDSCLSHIQVTGSFGRETNSPYKAILLISSKLHYGLD